MNNHANLAPYVACLEEIKARYRIIGSYQSGERDALFDVPTTEIMALQFRMIFELIALGSLAAHAEIFREQQVKFEKKWRPSQILKDVEKLNPNFYPEPVVEEKSPRPDVVNNLASMEDGYLTPENLLRAHGFCGNILHARNPFGKGVDHTWYREQMKQWSKELVALLSIHKIQLLDEDIFYLVHLHSKPDGKIQTYTFQKVDA